MKGDLAPGGSLAGGDLPRGRGLNTGSRKWICELRGVRLNELIVPLALDLTTVIPGFVLQQAVCGGRSGDNDRGKTDE